jgi:hypothetical protein
MARTMLDEQRTPRRYWAEAVNTACHVGNRIFLRAFMNKTCYDLMHGRSPRVSYFRAFGCRCFILKKVRLDKSESRSSDGIFLGYASHSRAFRALNIDTNLVVVTCKVTFDKTQPCNSSVFECADDEVGKIFEDEEDVSVLDWQTYQVGTRGGRLWFEDHDRETENSKVCARTRDTRFIQVRAAKVTNPTSDLGSSMAPCAWCWVGSDVLLGTWPSFI